uniref:RNase H type-1 domain-containing protein n=1 Tax=Brassica oleracea var. oleracea TaxID=109376 RepID=A0A0D3AYQ2_BRAOL
MSKSKELVFQKLQCESDSSQLIKAISLRKPPPPEIYGVITDILCLSLHFISVSFHWIPRDKNKTADCLAKQALASEAAVMNPSLMGI